MNKESRDITVYVLEERWYKKWLFVSSTPDLDWLINHMEDLKKRLGPYGKIEFRIRDEEDEIL